MEKNNNRNPFKRCLRRPPRIHKLCHAFMLACCKELGADEAGLVRYQTSGDIAGDFLRVVGYAAIIVR